MDRRWSVRALSPPAWLRAAAFAWSVPADSPLARSCPACGVPTAHLPAPSLTVSARCAACGIRLGPGPWIVEVATVAAAALLLTGSRSAVELPAYAWFAALGLLLAFIDAAVHRLPNLLTAAWVAGTLGGLILPAALESRWDDWLRALVGGIALTVAFGLVALVRSRAVGWGDVKAAATAGVALAWLGWGAILQGLMLTFALAFGYTVVLLVRGRAGRATRIPLGPFLVAGVLIVAAWYPPLV